MKKNANQQDLESTLLTAPVTVQNSGHVLIKIEAKGGMVLFRLGVINVTSNI